VPDPGTSANDSDSAASASDAAASASDAAASASDAAASASDAATSARWDALVAMMLGESTATYGTEGGSRRAFGSTALKTEGKIFAMVVKGRLVVKLPAGRVEDLVEAGAGERFDPGHGRIQKEWLSVFSDDPEQWHALAVESEAYVAKRGR
jgi:hypothetical protein